MRKVIFTMALMMVSSSAMAEWIKIAEGKFGSKYYDSEVIREGSMAFVWYLTDANTENSLVPLPFASIKFRKQYDCAESKSREIAMILFSDSMGEGNVISNKSVTKNWKTVTTNGKAVAAKDFDPLTKKEWELVCGKVQN